MKRYFKDEIEFCNYIIVNKPKELYLDEFHDTEPYIKITRYVENMILGFYNLQGVLLAFDFSKLHTFYNKNLYVKI